jgi:glycosyltransferase involved in cell wall biosynthesis
MNKKIGVGIITCNRVKFLKKLINSLSGARIDHLILVNDGEPIEEVDKFFPPSLRNVYTVHNNEPQRQNVGASKNTAMRYLLNHNCDYIFTLEDDIILKNPNIFNIYIQAYKQTGIHHFNFGFSQRENLDENLNPVYRKIVDYGETKIILTPNILGAFTFYTKHALQTIGLHYHEFNKGHGDHLELTYRAGVNGLTTPFWWFADIYESWKLIENQSDLVSDSIVRNPETFQDYFSEARNIFKKLHGRDIFDVRQPTESEVIKILKKLKAEKTSE